MDDLDYDDMHVYAGHYDDGFATYDDYVEMADDRDDSLDPEFRDPEGYCGHGNYVGGCGPDLMCDWCEAGISPAEAEEIIASRQREARRDRTRRRLHLRLSIGSHCQPGEGTLAGRRGSARGYWTLRDLGFTTPEDFRRLGIGK